MFSPLASVRRLWSAAVDLLLLRAEFASLELAQTRAQFVRWLALSLVSLGLALLALIAASALFAVLVWPALGWVTLLVLALAYGLGALLVMRRLQREVAEAPPLLAETLAELRKDREALLARASGTEASSSEGVERPAP